MMKKVCQYESIKVEQQHSTDAVENVDKTCTSIIEGVSMITDKSPSAICVTLIISTATSSDSGTYVCKPSDNLPSANITVNVLEQTDYTAMLSGAHTFIGGELPIHAWRHCNLDRISVIWSLV